jgi:nucleotide-binding universal stress UspA family protein
LNDILIPFDGSRPAQRAVEHALRLCKPGTTLHLLNVEPDLDDYGMVRAYLTRDEHRRAMAKRARQLLDSAVRRYARRGVHWATHVAFGDPAPAIARVARRLKCRSIIMGTRGLGNVAGMLLGSVATKTVHLSRIPVTLVR